MTAADVERAAFEEWWNGTTPGDPMPYGNGVKGYAWMAWQSARATPASLPDAGSVDAAKATGFGDGPSLSMRDLQRENLDRVPRFGMALDTWSPMEWCCAAAGELGELANVLKKRQRLPHPTLQGCDVTGKPTPTLKDAADEIADTIIYLDLLASRLGIDVSTAVRSKWNAVSEKMGHDRRLS